MLRRLGVWWLWERVMRGGQKRLDARQVLPLFLSFVCFSSSILLALVLSLPLHRLRLRDHFFDRQGPEGRLKPIQGVLSRIDAFPLGDGHGTLR